MDLPLKGVKVLDISRVLTGPFCTMMLADLGAEVIKVEMPGRGDETRSWGPPFTGGESAYYLSINRNKKSLTLNLKSEEGQKILKDLAKDCDVIIENFLPGTVDRLGADYESIKEINPQIIYCSISGFGQSGPYRDFPAYDLLMQGMGGLMSITGEKDGAPIRIGVALVDIGAGMYATMGIMGALMTKQSTNRGQYIDISLMDTEISWLTYMACNYFLSGKNPVRMGSAHPNIVPYQAFMAKDRYFILAVGNDQIWQRFCKAMNLEEVMEDPKFATNEKRVENRDELNLMLENIFATKNAEEWIKLLQDARVPCGPVNQISEVVNHPQTQHRGMVVEMDHPKAEKVKVLGNPINLSDTPPQYTQHPPLLGEHTEEILKDFGYSEEQIKDLQERGIV